MPTRTVATIVVVLSFWWAGAHAVGQEYNWISADDDDWNTNGAWDLEGYPESGNIARHEDTELTDVRIKIDRSVETGRGICQ